MSLDTATLLHQPLAAPQTDEQAAPLLQPTGVSAFHIKESRHPGAYLRLAITAFAMAHGTVTWIFFDMSAQLTSLVAEKKWLTFGQNNLYLLQESRDGETIMATSSKKSKKKKRKKASVGRNAMALAAILRNSAGAMKDKRNRRGGGRKGAKKRAIKDSRGE